MTRGQKRALERHWTRYGIDRPAAGPIEPEAVFGRVAPLVLEIGFGMGESLLVMAAAHPDRDYLGVEVYRPGVGHLLQCLHENGMDNVRIVSEDAAEVLQQMIPAESLHAILVFFPDPWPKKRHRKRRLVNAEFVALAASRLEGGGRLHMATDWEDYAIQMMAVLEGAADLRNCAGAGRYAERPAARQATRFERRGERLGHGVWDLLFEKRAREETGP